MSNLALILDSAIHGVAVGVGQIDAVRPPEMFSINYFGEVMNSAAKLPGLVASTVNQQGYSIDDLSYIVLNRGPGSFTGLRVGMSYGFGLGEGLRARLGRSPQFLGWEGLAIAARSFVSNRKSPATTVLRTSRTSGYIGCSLGHAKALKLIMSSRDKIPDDQMIVAPFELSEIQWSTLVDIGLDKTFVVGEWPELVEACGNYRDMVQLMDWRLAQETIIRGLLTHLDLHAKKGSTFLASPPEPLYLRRSTVEERAHREPRPYHICGV